MLTTLLRVARFTHILTHTLRISIFICRARIFFSRRALLSVRAETRAKVSARSGTKCSRKGHGTTFTRFWFTRQSTNRIKANLSKTLPLRSKMIDLTLFILYVHSIPIIHSKIIHFNTIISPGHVSHLLQNKHY